jgi:hypothetical protein
MPSKSAITLGTITLASLVPLLIWDVSPNLLPSHAHNALAALPLTLVAIAYVASQATRGGNASEFAKVVLCAVAFVFWALNQLLPSHPRATLFNDIAIVAFVLDIVLVIVGYPPPATEAAKAQQPKGAATQSD